MNTFRISNMGENWCVVNLKVMYTTLKQCVKII